MPRTAQATSGPPGEGPARTWRVRDHPCDGRPWVVVYHQGAVCPGGVIGTPSGCTTVIARNPGQAGIGIDIAIVVRFGLMRVFARCGTDSCLRREGGVLAHPLYLLLRIAAGPLSLSSMVRGFGLRNSLTRPAGTPIPPRECPRESGWEDMANDRVCHAALRCRPSISNQVFRAARHNGLGRFASQRTSEGGERQWEPGKMPWC